MTFPKTESFLPLTPVVASEKNRDFQAVVIPQSPSSSSFQDLAKQAHSVGAKLLANNNKNCEPKVFLERTGDRVTSIRIQCPCGQVMELACVYEEAIKPK